MSAIFATDNLVDIVYPESDGKPMAENTLQYEWIVMIKGGLDAVLPNDFVAGDLLWYPVEGKPKIAQAPDVMVAIGRPKGHRRSYLQWQEEHIAPQVVFEILSPGNTASEMTKKELFYNEHGVEEYYLYDPEKNDLFGWIRSEKGLTAIPAIDTWTSPRLGIRFERTPETLMIFRPDGRRFETFAELEARAEAEHQRAEAEAQRAEAEAQRAQQALSQIEQERLITERLKQKLLELGIDPETV
ncbi:MAG TPA: Uma2 family endonuclease [Acidobacteriota bacterium]|nr:Uma2 family endonuclease [Acidobacteriota bacterium]